MKYQSLNFGKYEGRTLPQIVMKDPDWFFWAYENKVFEGSVFLKEAEEVFQKATRIKIPENGIEELVAEYGIYRGKFTSFEIVPVSRHPHVGSTKVFRKSSIDLSVPRKVKTYDKLGGQILLDKVKECLFKGLNKRMTRKFCDEFFNDEDNFLSNT